MPIGSIVLAGGQSSRFGTDKCAQTIAGRTLIETVIGHLGSLSSEILIVVSGGQSRSLHLHPMARTVGDLYPGKGSLGGLHAGLTYSTCSHSLAVACDMPFLNLDLLRHMIELSPDFDVVIPRVGDKKEPLHAIYSKIGVRTPEFDIDVRAPNRGFRPANRRWSDMAQTVGIEQLTDFELSSL